MTRLERKHCRDSLARQGNASGLRQRPVNAGAADAEGFGDLGRPHSLTASGPPAGTSASLLVSKGD